jgi:hypothetical protein
MNLYPFTVSATNKKRIGAVALVLVILFAFGLRLGHPHDGLKNALGSAQSGIVLYKKGADLSTGAKVMVNMDAPAKSPIIAFIVKTNGKSVDIQSGANVETVKSSQIYGKLIAVIPFIGQVLSVIGL